GAVGRAHAPPGDAAAVAAGVAAAVVEVVAAVGAGTAAVSAQAVIRTAEQKVLIMPGSVAAGGLRGRERHR
ncbi:hypothetical protein, partial [Microbispora sp. NPDC049633]|uniref:hypothetical protein n=1 Tax=Microbispora sp. NPDC049633 TaxID=3154355 RepID=UPI003412E684